MPGLGGLRHARRDSTNRGWRNASFRAAYADYMQTATFRRNLDRCIDLAKSERVVRMCAEAVPWRCHRSLIADALLVRGIVASEITSGVRVRRHVLTPWARVKGTQITYPGATECASNMSPGEPSISKRRFHSARSKQQRLTPNPENQSNPCNRTPSANGVALAISLMEAKVRDKSSANRTGVHR